MKMFCPHCESNQEIKKIHKKEKLQVMEEAVEYDANVYRCTICKGEFATTEMEEENFQKAYNLYRDKYHLLRTEKIKEIRYKYGLSQKDFSRFLGWGEITIHRYESGSLQDTVHNEALVLVENPHNALKILELNRNALTSNLIQRVESRIRELLAEEKNALLLPLIEEKYAGVSLETGYKAFDIDKIENLIIYIALKCKGVLKTKLNKLLWYIDFKHFKEHTVGITGAKYLHLPLGPVPMDYELLTLKLQNEDRLEAQEVVKGEYTGENYVAKKEAEISIFNKEELETIDLVIKKLAHLGSGKIKDMSHKEKAYKMTAHKQIIPYSFAKDLSL